MTTFHPGDVLQRGRVRYVLTSATDESTQANACKFVRGRFSGWWEHGGYMSVWPHILVMDGWQHIPGPNHPDYGKDTPNSSTVHVTVTNYPQE